MSDHKFPRARGENIVSRRVQDELIIYDKARDIATCLNSFAADVWDRCDGRSSPAAIAQALSQSRSEPVDERAVWLAVNRLSRAKLLEEPIKIPPAVPGRAASSVLARLLRCPWYSASNRRLRHKPRRVCRRVGLVTRPLIAAPCRASQ